MDWHFMEVGYHLTEVAGDGVGWFGSMESDIFLQIKFIIFSGYPTKQTAFLPWEPASYNQLLSQPLLLVPECYFA